jgi:mannose-6-phosphate isomerase-like protein (cupin superfamily)
VTAAFANQYCHFYDDDAFDDTARAGFRQRVIDGDQLQLCFWRIDGGATGSVLHHHPENEQLGIIVRGALDFRIGEPDDQRRVVLRAGDVYLAPCSVWHGDSVFIGDDEYGECWILDVFAPPRPDLTPGPRARAAAAAGRAPEHSA